MYKKINSNETKQIYSQHLPKAMSNSLLSSRKRIKEPSSYNVSAICGCLRKEYFERMSKDDKYESIESRYLSRRGEGFEWLLKGYKYRQRDGSIQFKHDNKSLFLYGRLDGYDPEEQELVELKSVARMDKILDPNLKDLLQIQCYGTIFENIFPIKSMKLIYVGMTWPPKVFNIEKINMTEWMKSRVIILYEALKYRKPPKKEESKYCNYCPFQLECKTQPEYGNTFTNIGTKQK